MITPEQERLELVSKTMARRGFQVVVDGNRVRFVGAASDVEGDVIEAIESLKNDDSSLLTELLEDMGFVPDMDGKYLIASPA